MAEQLLYAAAATFEAARRVTILPEGHRSRRIHGHSFLANVRVALPNGWARFPGGDVEELRGRLQTVLAPLDYHHLNDNLPQPTDENLARWVRQRLELEDINNVGVQSTMHEGADLDRHDHAHIWRRYVFQSAHRLPNVPPAHKCGRMHGHGFEVILHANVSLGVEDLGVDYDHLDECWAPIHAEVQHACLNDIAGLENPTSELIANWIWTRLKPALPELSWVTVYETASCGAHFDGTRYRIWKELSLDSSLQLRRAPTEDPRRRIHGHTYSLRLHLDAPLDEVLGWTVDFGDVKDLFTPIFKQLDHQPLYELPGVEDNDTASLARWIKRNAAPILPQLDRIDLYETRGCGAILSWGEKAHPLCQSELMTYNVKEIYYTLQGEGAQTGRAAVFCRFAGCNLWSGLERDRGRAVCQFCDTDFVGTNGPGGGKFQSPESLADAVFSRWPKAGDGKRLVVCTGGEPLLQLDEALVEAFHRHDFEVAVETNGTQAPPNGLDWVCVSPKADAPVVVTAGDELKLVFPQPQAMPERFVHLAFRHFFLQPLDGPAREANTRAAVEYCLAHPHWRLSLQTHKYLNIP